MKLSVAAVAAAASVQALNLHNPINSLFGLDQASFQLPEAMDQFQTLFHQLVETVGDKIEDIPLGAVSAWARVMREFPEAVSKLSFKPDRYSGKVTPRDDWLYVVEDAVRAPSHNLKIRDPSSLGVDSVKQYSGYLNKDEGDKHFFFWFFESRNDPANDPIILWMNGGPGCSSLTGLFFELGPARINAKLEVVRNPWSWNNNASVIFLDQPVATGFSYSEESTVSDTIEASQDIYAFLSLFFKQFPEYSHLPFHISGESYAGHYVPQAASEVLKHADRNFNFTSMLVGNGLTDPLRQYDGYAPMACGEGGEPAVLDPEICDDMVSKQSRCNSMIEACYNTESAWLCVPATIYCNNAMMGPYQATGLNVYDVRHQCGKSQLCYDELEFVDQYLNKPEVKKAIGAEIDNYQGCNMQVNQNFVFAGDWMKPYYRAVVDVLDQGYPVLIYAGDKDFICNWVGNDLWSHKLEWSHGKEFGAAELKPWLSDYRGGKEVGQVRNYGHFSFLRVYDAGHMVPFDQAQNSVEMVNRWVSGEYAYA